MAGSHLEDPKTAEFNLPYIRKELPGEDLSVVTFARWEEGLVIASGTLRAYADLARRAWIGKPALLDRLLGNAGVLSHLVQGYDRVEFGHLAAAYSVDTHDGEFAWRPAVRLRLSA